MSAQKLVLTLGHEHPEVAGKGVHVERAADAGRGDEEGGPTLTVLHAGGQLEEQVVRKVAGNLLKNIFLIKIFS